MTLRLKDRAAPGEVRVQTAGGDAVQLRAYGDWVSDANGVYSRRYRLDLGPQTDPAAVAELRVDAVNSAGVLTSQVLPCLAVDHPR